MVWVQLNVHGGSLNKGKTAMTLENKCRASLRLQRRRCLTKQDMESAGVITEKMDQSDDTEMKSVASSKDTAKRRRRQATGWEKTFWTQL